MNFDSTENSSEVKLLKNKSSQPHADDFISMDNKNEMKSDSEIDFGDEKWVKEVKSCDLNWIMLERFCDKKIREQEKLWNFRNVCQFRFPQSWQKKH